MSTSRTRLGSVIHDAVVGDIASPVDGEIWYNSATQKLRSRQGGITNDLGIPGIGSLFFDATKNQHVNHGTFWRPNVAYSHFFWEAWLRPFAGNGAWTGYHVSDTDGGAHNLLWGVAAANSTFYTLTGNVYDGSTLTSFTTDEQSPFGHWTHVAVGWDGSHLMCWIDGVMSSVKAYSPAQRMNPGGNNMVLFVGGSDHNMYWGDIAQIRAYEGFGRCAQVADFIPELYFRPLGYLPTHNTPEFCVNYQLQNGIYVDTGSFEGIHHSGVPEALNSTSGLTTQSATKNDFALPTFEAGEIAYGTYTPTPPSTPSGAIVWDSFSRANRTYLSTPNGQAVTLGSTEAGTAGVLTWIGNGFGILNGMAFALYNQAGTALVDTSTLTVDVRVNRLTTSYCQTGLVVRYKDGNDFYYVQGTDTNIHVEKHEGGVVTTTDIGVPTGWKTLRVTASGTSFTIYTGTDTEGTFTSRGSFTGTNVTGATKAGIFQYSNIKQVYRYDNFLVK